jgi:long-chain acyl-CoA synthetase
VNLRSVLKERFDNASQSLPFYKRLKGFTVTLDELPLTAFGKLKRNEIKKIYEPRVIAGKEGALPVSGELTAADLLLTRSETGIKILECLKKQSGIRRQIILEDSLELDLGIDSLGRIELASCLEAAFSTGMKEEVISRAFSVKDLILGITDALRWAKDIPMEEQGVALGEDYWKEHLNVPPKEETMQMLELSTGYFAWAFRFILTAIDCLIFKVFFSIKEEGAQHVPTEGAYILYGNHTSFLDGPAIGACLPRRPVFQIFYFVFGPYFFRPFIKNRVLRNLVKMGRFIPFDFSTHFLEALRSCYFVLRHGKGLCFFPEGLRSTTGEIGEFKKGFGVLAKVTGAMLVPVAINGAHKAWGSTAKYPKRYSISVKFGKPLLPEDLQKEGLAMGAKDPFEAICLAARKALVELKREKP